MSIENTLPTKAEFLARIRHYIVNGWTQGANARANLSHTFGDPFIDYKYEGSDPFPGATCYCLNGALLKAQHDFDKNAKSVLRFSQQISEFWNGSSSVKKQCSYTMWNDDRKRTKEQVLSLIDATPVN